MVLPGPGNPSSKAFRALYPSSQGSSTDPDLATTRVNRYTPARARTFPHRQPAAKPPSLLARLRSFRPRPAPGVSHPRNFQLAKQARDSNRPRCTNGILNGSSRPSRRFFDRRPLCRSGPPGGPLLESIPPGNGCSLLARAVQRPQSALERGHRATRGPRRPARPGAVRKSRPLPIGVGDPMSQKLPGPRPSWPARGNGARPPDARSRQAPARSGVPPLSGPPLSAMPGLPRVRSQPRRPAPPSRSRSRLVLLSRAARKTCNTAAAEARCRRVTLAILLPLPRPARPPLPSTPLRVPCPPATPSPSGISKRPHPPQAAPLLPRGLPPLHSFRPCIRETAPPRAPPAPPPQRAFRPRTPGTGPSQRNRHGGSPRCRTNFRHPLEPGLARRPGTQAAADLAPSERHPAPFLERQRELSPSRQALVGLPYNAAPSSSPTKKSPWIPRPRFRNHLIEFQNIPCGSFHIVSWVEAGVLEKPATRRAVRHATAARSPIWL